MKEFGPNNCEKGAKFARFFGRNLVNFQYFSKWIYECFSLIPDGMF